MRLTDDATAERCAYNDPPIRKLALFEKNCSRRELFPRTYSSTIFNISLDGPRAEQ
jgi:hypothetical protein